MGHSINGPRIELNWTDPVVLLALGFKYAFGQVSTPHILAYDEHHERMVWPIHERVLKDCANELRVIALQR